MENNKKIPTYIYALGGLEEIGKNTYVVEHDDEILVVDAGIKFGNATMPGFDGTVANFDYLVQNYKGISGLVITHGHEDHIGGIPHLLRQVPIKKIYAPPLAAKLIQRKIGEYKDLKKPEIIVFEDKTMFKTKNFEVDFYRVCHSIPDSFGVCIKTPNGYVVSTGDFRFDFGTAGDQTDLFKIAEISARGIDVLLSETTSAEVPGFSSSECFVIKNIADYMSKAKGRVFVSTFASNLGRVEQIIDVAVKMNKKICIIGKSMEANVKTSRALGYLKVAETTFISSKELKNYPDNEIAVILTGSQGESMAALNVMANGKHSKISLKPSDTIILSSNPIPGNWSQVEVMVNKLYRLGVTVYENTPSKKIHASGHATQSELQMMIKAVNPKYLFPIHGEYKMLRAMQKNAMNIGFKKENVIIAVNGEKLQLLDGVLSRSDIIVDATPNYINGNDISTHAASLLKERFELGNDGVISISLIGSKTRKQAVLSPTITTRGCFYARDSINLINRLSTSAKTILSQDLNGNDFNINKTTKAIAEEIRSTVWKWRKKNPVVLVDILFEEDILEKKEKEDYIQLEVDQEFDDLLVEEYDEMVDNA